MDWVTAVLCGLQEDREIRIAIIKTEIAKAKFILDNETDAEFIKIDQEILRMWQQQLARLESKENIIKFKRQA